MRASLVVPVLLVFSLAFSQPARGQSNVAESPAPAGPDPVATPATGLPLPSAAQAEAMMQTFERMRTLHQQLRAQTRDRMLAALSPAHRSAVAALVGQLAISPNPDRAVAARQIDATLAPSEREAIFRIDAAAVAGASDLARQMQAQIIATLTPEQRTALDRQMAQARLDMQRTLSPEQRAALQRATGGAGLPLTLSPVAGSLPLTPGGAPQNAGSVLLSALTLSESTPYGVMSSVHVGGSVLRQTVPANPPH